MTLKNTSTGAGLRIDALRAGAAITVNASGASTSVLRVTSATGFGFVSTASAASLSYALKVDVGGVIYFVPVYLGVA